MICSKFSKSAADTYRCNAWNGKCDEPEKECPMKEKVGK
jgi:hypothetical protein